MAQHREHLFKEHLKGIIRTLFCFHENLPHSLSIVDITNIFVNSSVHSDVDTNSFFISFNLTHLHQNRTFDVTLRFLRRDFFHHSIDGYRFFLQKEYNSHDKIFYLELSMEAFLYYLVSLL